MKEFAIPQSEGMLRYQDLPAYDSPGKEGAGEAPLLCLHGVGCAGSFDMVNMAAQRPLGNRRRILVDLPGAGYSDAPKDFGYSIEDHGRCLLALADHLELERFAIFGHSLGGAVTLALAARCAPGRLVCAVIGEGNLDPGGGTFTRRIAKWPLGEWLDRGFAEMLDFERRHHNGLWAASLEKWDGEALWRIAQSAVRGGDPDWRETLYRLECPKYYVFGERTLPDPDAEELPKHGVRVEVLPNTGHSMTWENPEGLARVIAEAIGKEDSSLT